MPAVRSHANDLRGTPRLRGQTLAQSDRPSAPTKRDVADRILDGMIRVFYEARQHSQSLKARYGITAAQLQLLKLLEKQGDLTHSELSERLYLRGSTVSGIIDRLEKRELVKRHR